MARSGDKDSGESDTVNLTSLFMVTGRIEAFSLLLLLLVAMPIKYMAGEPIYVRYVGMAHGITPLACSFLEMSFLFSMTKKKVVSVL